jgi:hypothetical protein
MESKLLQHTIELSPVIRWKRIQVNFRVGRVKDKSSVVFESEVSHNVDGSLKMTFTGIRKIG